MKKAKFLATAPLILFAFCCAAADTAPKAKPKRQSEIVSDWVPRVYVDKMTDKKSCLVVNRKDPRILYDPVGTLTVDFARRGGVRGYQWRIDKSEASPYQLTRQGQYDRVAVWDVRGEFSTANQVTISGVTWLSDAIDMTIDLRGITIAGEAAKKLCEEN